MRWVPAFVLLGWMIGGFGCSDECESAGDCRADEVCREGSCVAREMRPPPKPFDGGPQPDATAPDAIVTPEADGGEDAGATPDTGGGGSADSGPDAGDGGPPPDAAPDAGMTGGDGGAERVGLIEVSEVRTPTGTTELRVFGRFFEHDQPAVTNAFAAPNVSCELVDRAGPRGRTRGLSGDSVLVSGFIGPFVPVTVTLLDFMPGLFEPKALNPITLFPPNQGPLTHEVADSTTPGEIDQATVMLRSIPDGIDVQVPVGNQAPLVLGAATLDFTWSPIANSGLTVIAEISDRPRNLVLRCETSDRGMLSVPLAARQAFQGRNPVAPVRIELLYEARTTMQVPIVGSGAQVPTVVRHIAGTRWLAQ